ncbi:hypothetical protein F511_35264 [Dorcoceras hygrometricum]|uniref:Uncharacterized protein n=1 Tax=Dorcoceras hygrometricum TaxID=472368 RepID=A0A2Z7AZQ2_9LAMI|nr:hypothetical protein F511_35264 [Dorcoceras hygrometricum]
MASSTFTNAYLVDFESVLNIPDNEGMQNMFKALESSGLRVNWSKVVFGVLEEMVDRTVKKAKGYGAQISVLLNSVPVLTMGKATSFMSSKILSPKTVLTYITTNQTADTHGKSDEGGKTPVAIVKRASKSKKKSESTSDAPVEIVSAVVVSKKQPAVDGSEPVVRNKRRTTKGKVSTSTANMDMASVVQGAVPLQVIAPTPAVTAVQPPAPKRKSCKRNLILSEGSDDDNVEENIDVASVKVAEVNVEESIEKVSHVSAEQIFTETDVGDIVFGDSTADNPEELAQWLENYISEGAEQVNESDSDRVQRPVDTVDVEQLFEIANVEEAEGSKHPVVEKDLVQAVGSKKVAEELMSIDYLLLQISDDMLLPSVTAVEITKIRLGESISINEVQERDLYYASLPRIYALDKGKEILEEDLKGILRGVTAGANSLEIRKEFKALDAKINSLDGQVAAIRSEQLEFQARIAADLLSLSTQLGDLVEYIRGGDAKKGEGSSRRRPLPTPVHQNIAIGSVMVAENRLEDYISEDIYHQTSLLYREVFCQQISKQCKRCLLTPDNATVFVIGTVRVTFAINRFGNSKFNGTSFAINRYEHSRNIRSHDVTTRYSYNGCITDMMTSATVE